MEFDWKDTFFYDNQKLTNESVKWHEITHSRYVDKEQ